ncbi:MAG: hypothetical protein QGH15_08700 [Kiritimatiellia bacterium]|jgi:hypothetical protein|nr:hypothetical protein [Kiritimatiellia bacterium]
MNKVSIEIEGGRTSYAPGEEIRGTATWELEKEPRSVVVNLLWYTRGKGTRDAAISEGAEVENPDAGNSCDFSFAAPAAPYSFSGRLVSLIWAVELVTEKPGKNTRQEIMISPKGSEIKIYGGGEPNDEPVAEELPETLGDSPMGPNAFDDL